MPYLLDINAHLAALNGEHKHYIVEIKMKSTITDVAKLAGVSIKTVSRVINMEDSVTEETLKRVSKAITQLNYQPNNAARNLKGTNSYTLGFVYDNPNAYYIIEMQEGILAECHERGYELIIHPCKTEQVNIVNEIKAMAKRSQLAGLVISPPLSETPEVLAAIEELDLSYVRIISGCKDSVEPTPCVFIHDREAAYKITEHLIEQGHKDIAFIGGDKGHHSTDERLSGYLAALKDHDIQVTNDFVVDGQYTFDSGATEAKKLLSLSKKPTAIFCCNDEIGAGALFAARLIGFDIPSQLAIAGFEDSPFSRQTWPQLTTAAQPTNLIARKAASLLISTIAAKRSKAKTGHAVTHQHFEPQLLVRESTRAKSDPKPVA